VDASHVMIVQAGQLFGKRSIEEDTLKVTHEDLSDEEKVKLFG